MTAGGTTPRIALVHAVTVAMEPVLAEFRSQWPDAFVFNILEDALSPDRERDDDLTEEMVARIGQLGDYAYAAKADGILYTCSAFGPAIERTAARLPVPVLKPNEAMFAEALALGERIGMVATFPSSVASMEAEFRATAETSRASATLETVLQPAALEALKRGDAETHNRLVAEASRQLAECDAIMLAHFSTSRAGDAVAAEVSCPVITSPTAAVRYLKSRLGAS